MAFPQYEKRTNDEAAVNITARFITKLAQELKVPETPLVVPANLTRYGLSQIINHLLALDPARPFDFLIGGELLRQSLHKHLLAKNISAETTLDIEYVPAVLPPQTKEKFIHDDWVSSVIVLPPLQDGIATGSYDGSLRLWKKENVECLSHLESAHSGPIRCLSIVPNSSLLLSAGDTTIKAWMTGKSNSSFEHMAVFKGHTEPIASLAVSPDGTSCATGGWDNQILMWSTEISTENSSKQKKRKVVEEHTSQRQLQQHSQCVAALCWPSRSTLLSASWDHSLKVWDVETGSVVETLHHNKALHAISTHSTQASVVALGGAEHTLRLWDRRSRGAAVPMSRALSSSHTHWIVSIAWHSVSAHHIATASHDGTSKLWDIRTSIPLATLTEHDNDKVLCGAWIDTSLFASGGSDSRLRTVAVDV